MPEPRAFEFEMAV